MKRYVAAWISLLALLFVGGQQVSAQTDTPTPTATFTPSPTLSNDERVQLATIGPPVICGSAYQPCGPIPWGVQVMPTLDLPSPTFRATLSNPDPLVASPTPTPTSTGNPTATVFLTLDSVQTASGALQDIALTLNAQGTQQFYINETPVAAAGVVQELSQHVGIVFGFAKAIQNLNFGKMGYVIQFALLVIAFVLIVYVVCFSVPIVLWIIRFVLQIIDTIKPI